MLLSLGLLTGLMLWRGDQVGAQVLAVLPTAGVTNASTLTTIEITFDQPMLSSSGNQPITLTPPIEGTTSWDGSTLIFTPVEPLQPNTTYTINLVGSLQSKQGRALISETAWQFTTRAPHLLYIALDDNEYDQLYRLDLTTQETQHLTNEPKGIYDFTVTPDGQQITYSAWNEESGRDLWRLDIETKEKQPLLMCPNAVCNGIKWSPDGTRVVYEKRNILVPGGAPGPPRLWWLNPSNSETVPVFEDKQLLGYGASWSADGEWLSYVAPSSQGVQIYNIETGESILIPSRTGALPAWHPYNNSLITSDIQANDAGFAAHLFRVTPQAGELINISGANQVEDSSPVWSPDGEWLVFTRKLAGTAMGKQVWLMRSDGSEAHYLTDEPDLHHSFPSWSQDGKSLLFQRFPLKELGSLPSIWWLDIETETVKELVSTGNQPTWLP